MPGSPPCLAALSHKTDTIALCRRRAPAPRVPPTPAGAAPTPLAARSRKPPIIRGRGLFGRVDPYVLQKHARAHTLAHRRGGCRESNHAWREGFPMQGGSGAGCGVGWTLHS